MLFKVVLKLTDIYTLVIIHIDRYQCFGAEVLELNMNKNYEIHSGKLKALSDTNRLMIIDMLSCGELCACEILEKFNITQPTLSHHMKILCECGLVLSRKDGKNNFYCLNELEIKGFKAFLSDLFQDSDDCICK